MAARNCEEVPAMRKIRWGVLSVSNHYRLRVDGQIRESALNEVLGIASRDGAKAAAEAARLGIPRSYGSYEALLADPEIDAVYIPLPNHLHAEYVKKAAAAGKHVLCEKPFAMNAAEAAEAIAYARSRGVKVMEAFMYRFHPQWEAARSIVRRGELGPIVSVQVRYAYNNRDPGNIRNIPEMGGGALMDIGCYAVSCTRYILGAEPLRVLSLIKRDSQFGTDILSSGLLDFGATQAQFTVSTQAFPTQRVEVTGVSGSLTVEIPYNMYADVPAEVIVRTNVGTRNLRCGPAGQYALMFDAFSACVIDDTPEPTPPEAAVANMRVLDALFRSEASSSWETPGRA